MPSRGQGVEGGAVGSGPIAEGGLADFDAVALGAPFHGVEVGVERGEEEVVEFGDAAADDDEFGVEGADQAGEVGGEGVDGFVPDGLGEPVAGLSGGGQVAGHGEFPAGAIGHGGIADGDLDAARGAGDGGGPVVVDGEVAEVAGAAEVTAEQAAVGDDGAADAGAQGEQDDVAAPAGGSLPEFAEQGGMGVVEDRHGVWMGQGVLPAEVFQSQEPPGHEGDVGAVAGGEARRGHADVFRGSAEFAGQFGEDAFDLGQEGGLAVFLLWRTGEVFYRRPGGPRCETGLS